jgi:hypothetical protein
MDRKKAERLRGMFWEKILPSRKNISRARQRENFYDFKDYCTMKMLVIAKQKYIIVNN